MSGTKLRRHRRLFLSCYHIHPVQELIRPVRDIFLLRTRRLFSQEGLEAHRNILQEIYIAIRERVEETLKICGLYPFRNWPISALSFGQKKRVTIASVLVQNPELIILDEPTAGQDFHHYTEIMEFLRKLNEEGVTVVMITHDMHLMLEYTPRALVFADGQIGRAHV